MSGLPEVWREFDARNINTLINHPDVRADVADLGDGVLDISAPVANKANVLLMGEWGGCFCYCLQPGLYEVHTQALPEGRGRWVLDFVRAGMHWMFVNTDAVEIMTRVPRSHAAAKAVTLAAGMRYEFSRDPGVKFRGVVQPVDIYSIRIQDWISTHPEALADRGEWLHQRMLQEARRLGVSDPPHDDDDSHNVYVGATYEMAAAGQMRKAVIFYNRWAIAARQKTIALVSEDPPAIRMDLGIMRFRDGDVEVVREI